jgi:hypothetical protein
MDTIHERARQIRRGESNQHPSQSFPQADIGIDQWIFVHARDLYYRDVTDPFYLPDGADNDRGRFEERVKSFRPYEKAYAAVAAATGYTVSAVEKMLQVTRRVAVRHGLPIRRRSQARR